MITTIKISQDVATRGLTIASYGMKVLYNPQRKNFYGDLTTIGAEIYSTSKCIDATDLNQLNFITKESQPIQFEVGI